MEPLRGVAAEVGTKKERRAEREARARFFESARDLMPFVSVEAGDDVFFVPTNDFRIGANLFVRRRSKDMLVLGRAMHVLDEVDMRLPAAPVFVEVGANLGTASTTALRRHGFASAVAIEPSPVNFKALLLGLVANDLESRVRAMRFAVSDREGKQHLDVSRSTGGAHRLVVGGEAPPDGAVVVDVVTLDALVARGDVDPGRAGLVWVDTAGHEASALAGGRSLLARGIPVVTAIKHGWPETEAALVELLTPYYTDVVDLRGACTPRPVGEFGSLIDDLTVSTDVLLFRR